MTDAPLTDAPMPRREQLGRAAEGSIVMVAIAAVALMATAFITFVWGCFKVVDFVELLVDDGSGSDLAIVELLEVIDVYLLGAVLLILAIGLVELFVTPLRLPEWLVIESLTDLKAKLIDVVQLVAAIKFLEKLVTAKEPLDVLWYALAVSVVILALLAVRFVQKRSPH